MMVVISNRREEKIGLASVDQDGLRSRLLCQEAGRDTKAQKPPCSEAPQESRGFEAPFVFSSPNQS